MVKVSNDDLEYLEPGRRPDDRRPQAARGRAAVALVTLGGDGALIVTADARTQVAAPKIKVVDTIGAGDAFGGGFLAYWRARASTATRSPTRRRCGRRRRFACVVAARTCERAGASPPRLSDLDGDL